MATVTSVKELAKSLERRDTEIIRHYRKIGVAPSRHAASRRISDKVYYTW